MSDPGFPVEMVRGVPVVTAPQEIDITNADGLRAALLEAAPHGTLVVDMTRTQFCDTAGLHALVGAHKRARAEGREVVLVITGAAVLRILAITGLDQLIPHVTSLEEALEQTSATSEPGSLPAYLASRQECRESLVVPAGDRSVPPGLGLARWGSARKFGASGRDQEESK